MPPTGAHIRDHILTARSIRKDFRGVPALRDVSFSLARGEVHVLAGENGAGKSTLIKVLTGVHSDFSGSLELDGRPVRFSSPSEANAAGISVIHQELSLVDSMSVADCFFLGRERARGPLGWLDRRGQHAAAHAACREAGLEIDVSRPVGELSVAVKSRLEIARALSSGARILILDEPTSALGPEESVRLLGQVERLRSTGCGVIYISHRLYEIYRLADRVTILRDGESVGTWRAVELPEGDLVRRMIGSGVESSPLLGAATSKAEALRLSNVSVSCTRASRVGVAAASGPRDVSLVVRPGEILGIAGFQGSGTHTLLEGLFGAHGRAAFTGHATLFGEPYEPTSPRASLRRGVALLTADRKADGIVRGLSVRENLRLAVPGAALQWISPARERASTSARVLDLGIRCRDVEQEIATLSGGNQQKALLARWLETRARLLLLCEPTRGVDLGARREIHRILRARADAGAAILLATSDLQELLALSDRVLVMHRGAVTGELARANATTERVLALAMGGSAA